MSRFTRRLRDLQPVLTTTALSGSHTKQRKKAKPFAFWLHLIPNAAFCNMSCSLDVLWLSTISGRYHCLRSLSFICCVTLRKLYNTAVLKYKYWHLGSLRNHLILHGAVNYILRNMRLCIGWFAINNQVWKWGLHIQCLQSYKDQLLP